MDKYKEKPKYNVLSIRVTDEEKAQFEAIKINTKKNISMLMREALHHYFEYLEIATSKGHQCHCKDVEQAHTAMEQSPDIYTTIERKTRSCIHACHLMHQTGS